MIQIECSSCNKSLAIDDAFAGSVCRCQYCGTIQTVPKAGQAASSEGDSHRALFKRKSRIESALSPYSDDLERAADEMDSASLSPNAIASSPSHRSANPPSEDIGSSRTAAQASRRAAASTGAVATPKKATEAASYMPRPSRSAAAAAPQPPRKSKVLLAAGICAGAILLSAIAAYAFFIGYAPETDAPKADSATAITNPAAALGANVQGTPLTGGTIVYILDRSGVTQEAFGKIVSACLKSVESLGSSRTFQIMVWNGLQQLSYPADKPLEASGAQVAIARKAIVDTYAGSSDLAGHLVLAANNGATDVVVFSAVDADEHMATEIRQALTGKSVRLHSVAVGADLRGTWMRRLSEEFGGSFTQVPLDAID